MANSKGLKRKDALFCYYYYRLRNSTEAAIRAGFLPRLAERAGIRLLERADIRQRIQALEDQQTRKELEHDAIAGLRRLAFGTSNDSISLLFSSEEELSQRLSALDLFLISEIKKPKENMLELKFFDRTKALEKLLALSEGRNQTDSLLDLYKALEKSASVIKEDQPEDE